MTKTLKTIALCGAATLTVSGCMAPFDPANPGQVTQSDRQQGAEAHPQILAEFGGAYNGPGVQMVERVGKQMAVQSGISQTGNDCTVTYLNSSIVNAFALPGCYVYVTRGLTALMENEAQLASVLGHEIGHVAAQHGKRRQNASLGAGLLGVLAGVLTGSGQIAQAASQLGQVWTLKYSRDQEYQADDLGIRYMTGAGYDPYEASEVLEALEDQSSLEAQLRGQSEASQMPAWARTHPLSADRVQRSLAQAKATGVAPDQLAENRDQFMTSIDDTLYGDAPSQGFVRGNSFLHPTLKLGFSVPSGFYLNNSARAVTATSGSSQTQIQFAGGSSGGNISTFAQKAVQGLLGQSAQNAQVTNVQTGTSNGMRTATQQARVATQSGQVDLTVVAYEFDANTAYYFAFLTPANANDSSIINSVTQSFRKLSNSEAAALRPRFVEVVTVGRGDTVASLSRRMAFDNLQEQRFRVLNDLERGGEVTPGQKVKIIVERAS